jgi:hypothetical protein
MNDEQFKKITKEIIKAKKPGVKDSEIDLHQGSAFYWGAENFAQASDWIIQTIKILSTPDKVSNRDLFINFFGILDDSELSFFLREKTSKTFELLGVKEAEIPSFISSNKNNETREFLQRVWDAKNLIEIIRNDFTEDEKFLLRFLRHRHCHVTLSNFGVRLEGKGEDVKIKTANWQRLTKLAESKSVSDIRRTLLEKLSRHTESLSRLQYLIAPSPGKRLLPNE